MERIVITCNNMPEGFAMSTGTPATRTLNWAQVDVFAERALEGNMLAIFTDARGLSDAEMQALARETNLSETTFILPKDDITERQEGVRVRIFTVAEELPFAGHPTLGTASWLWANHPALRGEATIKLKLNVGTVPVTFRTPDVGEYGVFGEMRQRDPVFGDSPDAAALTAACGLTQEDLHATLRPQVVSTGLPFCIVPVASVEALQRMRYSPELSGFLDAHRAKFAYAITPVEGGWRARMPFYGGDDPATGSAAGCAISYLVRHGGVAPGEGILMQQGIEVHRPSRLHLRASLFQDAVTDVFVGGRTIPVAAGTFMLP
jgi:trans-2,3-dihydro-3-hydroxyanthranilate isomerase